jgi:type II secretory pathway pseudopilin PulG
MVRRERGAGGVFIFVVLVLAMIFIVAVFMVSRMSSSLDARAQTTASLAAAAAALEQFASQTGRLPCPANPALDTGLADPNNASVNCNNATGTLPWATIGMRRDDALDAWGWKIAYRVYSGNGGMTQANGASMVNCDTIQALTARQPVDGNKLCPVAHDTVDTDFIAGKGLSVTDFGTVYDGTKASGGAAYVLISAGASGYGAYTGAGLANPNTPKSNDEKNNLKATGPFVLEAASDPTVSPDDNAHYDDILMYRTVADLAKKANLVARDWPDTILAGVKFDSTTVGNALGHSPGSGDLGVSSLSFPYATVSGYNSGGTADLAFASGSTTGLGGGGGSGNNLDSSAGEGIQIKLNQQAQRLAVTLGNFGTGSFFFFPYSEQARFDFYIGSGSSPVYSTTVAGCKSDGGLASFTINTGVQFDSVKVTSIASTIVFQPSSFNIAEFDTCGATGTCVTTLDTGAAPTGNHCSP